MPDNGGQEGAKESAKKRTSFWDSLKQYAVATAVAMGFAQGEAPSSVPSPAKEKAPEPVAVTFDVDNKAKQAKLAEKLAVLDAQRFTELYGKHTDELVKGLEEYKKEYARKERALMPEISAAIEEYRKSSSYQDYQRQNDEVMKKFLSGELSQDESGEKMKALQKEYRVAEIENGIYESKLGLPPERYANKTFGLGDGSESYCLALQTEALRRTAEEMGIPELDGMRDACGWTVKYAENSFKDNGFGKDVQMSDLFTLDADGNAVVNKDADGNPLAKDGDMALLKQNGEVYHCVRLNIDENGVMTYSAGNEDRDHAPAGFIGKSEAVLVSTGDYVRHLAEQHYTNKKYNDLLAVAEIRGIGEGNTVNFADARAQLKKELREQVGELPSANPLAISANLRIDKFLQARANRPDEVLGRTARHGNGRADAQNLPNPPTHENWIKQNFER